MYMVTQLAKMLFLATFFPVAVDEEEDPNIEVPFDFLTVSDFQIIKPPTRQSSFHVFFSGILEINSRHGRSHRPLPHHSKSGRQRSS